MVHPRTTVAVVHGAADPSLDAVVVKAIRTGTARTFEQDPTLALRVLVDIALRALSPAINDPTTAVQVLDCEESLLRMLVGRDLQVGEITGPRGNMRVLLTLPDWHDYVALAVDEIVEAGVGQARIRQRVERLLRDLLAVAPASRRDPLQARLDDLMSTGRRPMGDAARSCPGRFLMTAQPHLRSPLQRSRAGPPRRSPAQSPASSSPCCSA